MSAGACRTGHSRARVGRTVWGGLVSISEPWWLPSAFSCLVFDSKVLRRLHWWKSTSQDMDAWDARHTRHTAHWSRWGPGGGDGKGRRGELGPPWEKERETNPNLSVAAVGAALGGLSAVDHADGRLRGERQHSMEVAGLASPNCQSGNSALVRQGRYLARSRGQATSGSRGMVFFAVVALVVKRFWKGPGRDGSGANCCSCGAVVERARLRSCTSRPYEDH